MGFWRSHCRSYHFTCFENRESGTISGKISPPDGAKFAWAISGHDSSKAAIAEGKFLFKLKPGEYKIVVDATDPLKDAVVDAIQITDGKNSRSW
jgi:hypothetical protein